MTKQERQKERLDARAFKAWPPGHAPGPCRALPPRVMHECGCHGRSARPACCAAAARRVCVCLEPCASPSPYDCYCPFNTCPQGRA